MQENAGLTAERETAFTFPFLPQTGDTSPIEIWLVALLLSLGGGIVLVWYKKKG